MELSHCQPSHVGLPVGERGSTNVPSSRLPKTHWWIIAVQLYDLHNGFRVNTQVDIFVRPQSPDSSSLSMRLATLHDHQSRLNLHGHPLHPSPLLNTAAALCTRNVSHTEAVVVTNGP